VDSGTLRVQRGRIKEKVIHNLCLKMMLRLNIFFLEKKDT